MTNPQMPEQSEEIRKRIRLVRRDMSDMLFHFTRAPDTNRTENGLMRVGSVYCTASAAGVLKKILTESCLVGTGTWTAGVACVCFTEAPIQEFAAIFSLVQIAASLAQRPRYEPYGIAVTKEWFFRQGGRPVIYERPSEFSSFSESQQYRLVPYDPEVGTDFTWEREWRIRTDHLRLDPMNTLVVVPTANEAFEFVSYFAENPADWADPGTSSNVDVAGEYRIAQWLAVSLDLFGVRFDT